jgi:hypothetical protein
MASSFVPSGFFGDVVLQKAFGNFENGKPYLHIDLDGIRNSNDNNKNKIRNDNRNRNNNINTAT